MNKKSAVRKGYSYREEGIGTITILMAAATVAIIFFSIYNAV